MNDILSSNFRSRIVAIYGFLVAVNIGAWVWAIIAFLDKPAESKLLVCLRTSST